MKNLISSVFKRQGKTNSQSVPAALRTQPLFYLAFLICTFFTACKKDVINETKNAEESVSSRAPGTTPNFLLSYNVSNQTFAQLMQVRAATVNLQDTASARRAGYVPVITLPNMGLHYANFGLAGKFDLAHPPFLVYNTDENGVFRLVAVEYGVPMIDRNDPNEPQPAGFTGDDDQWDPNTLNLGLWTLHAWVWNFNPNGVFAMSNPNVP